MNYQFLQEIWLHHSGKITGAMIGMIVGILIILFGFFKTLFVLICTIAGYIIGKRIDEKEDLVDILDRLLPPGYYR